MSEMSYEPDDYDTRCPTCDAPEPAHTPTCAVVHSVRDELLYAVGAEFTKRLDSYLAERTPDHSIGSRQEAPDAEIAKPAGSV
ncbi:hypothetical protein [Leifsonia aquatica]|uniref:hypothetical protein n=1 Tax=Leifsonia aquatica TaxID=144185 RepID=UPI00382CFE3B